MILIEIVKSTIDILYTTTSTTSTTTTTTTTSSSNTTNSTTITATSSSGGRSIVYTKLPVNHLNVTVEFYL